MVDDAAGREGTGQRPAPRRAVQRRHADQRLHAVRRRVQLAGVWELVWVHGRHSRLRRAAIRAAVIERVRMFGILQRHIENSYGHALGQKSLHYQTNFCAMPAERPLSVKMATLADA